MRSRITILSQAPGVDAVERSRRRCEILLFERINQITESFNSERSKDKVTYLVGLWSSWGSGHQGINGLDI